MKNILFYFAVAGWLLSLTVHLAALGGIGLTEKYPGLLFLHVGIFVVWVPAIFYLRNNNQLQKNNSPKLFTPITGFRTFFKGVPRWLAIIAISGFIYAALNFAITAFAYPYSPGIKDGQYVLYNHSQIIKSLTEKEYISYTAAKSRLFSGHWFAFYGMAAALLYPFKENLEIKNP